MTEPESSNFSGRLKQAMEGKSYSANRLAQLLDTSASRVKGWLDGVHLPGGNHMVRLPGVLDVDGHWLLTGKGDMKPLSEGDAERKLQAIRGILNGVPEDEAERAKQSAAAARASSDSREPKARKRPGTGRSGGTASSGG